jgi:adenosylcobalamin-dependent ribonucleoside-triphosphate reductase
VHETGVGLLRSPRPQAPQSLHHRPTAGTKSLLTGASPGWHPPKAQRFIRRITFRKNDPVAMACIDYGYSVVPSQSDKDDNGNLLNDPFDPRCTEWLVEIPVEVPWANLPGADEVAIEKFSAAAQFDFYMQVQKHYTTHNTSATIEFREPEIEFLGERIYQAIQTTRATFPPRCWPGSTTCKPSPGCPSSPSTRPPTQPCGNRSKPAVVPLTSTRPCRATMPVS